jgi:small conductance mechanosensitive channel
MRKRFRPRKDLHLDRVLDKRGDAWERVGLAVDVSHRAVRRARRQALVLGALLLAILVAYSYRKQLFGAAFDTPVRIATVLLLVVLGWAIARDVGRAAAPTFFRRMDPGTAGTVGFLIRLATIALTRCGSPGCDRRRWRWAAPSPRWCSAWPRSRPSAT